MSEIVKTYYGNLDGKNQGCVIAKSKKQAAEIVGCSLYMFNQYWSQGRFAEGLKPYVLYTQPYSSSYSGEDKWRERQ